MTGLIDAAWTISGWKERRNDALHSLEKSLGVDISKIVPDTDWVAIPTTLYFTAPPCCYYLEPTFTEYYSFLTSRYNNDLGLFASDLASCGQDVWKGLGYAESLAHEILSTNLDAVDEYQRINNNLNPWYLRLVEQAFDSLLNLPAYRLQQDSGKSVTQTPWSIHEVIKKHGWTAAGSYYDATMRNGIGHDVEFIQNSPTSDLVVRYTDSKGNQIELTPFEIRENVEGLVDECLGYCFALRLFVFERRNAKELAGIVHATTETHRVRELYFKQVAGSPIVIVEAVHRETVNGQTQIRIECRDDTTDDNERLVEVLSILAIASDWFPEGETFFIGLTGKKRLASCLRISGKNLREWLQGNIADDELSNCFEPNLLWPLKKWFGSSRAKWRRVWRACDKQLKAVKTWRNHSTGEFAGKSGRGIVEDISTGLARRYRAIVFLDKPNQDEVKATLPSILQELQAIRLHKNATSRKRWGRAKPHFVSAFLFSREKRRRDLWADESAQFYIGQFEWRDASFDNAKLPIALEGQGVEQLSDGIIYKPNGHWPPIDIFVPRN